MKTQPRLFDRITEYSNLLEAARRAARGKRERAEVKDYFSRLDEQLADLRRFLLTDEVPLPPYRYFTIADPKERTICAAPFSARVLHHALINVCGPTFERGLVAQTYACRKGMGQYAALDAARAYHCRFDYCVKLDVRKYFDSIPHDRLKAMLRRLFRERRLLALYDRIIDSYETTPGRGLPIGNLTSQYFANLYLSPIDHAALEYIRVGGYVRYMDDILLYDNDRREIMEKAKAVRERLAESGLSLKIIQLRATAQTTEFLGYRLKGRTLLLSRRSMKRYRKKCTAYNRLLECGEWTIEDYLAHIRPLTAFVEKSDDIAFRRKVHKAGSDVAE